jgi:predicted porin
MKKSLIALVLVLCCVGSAVAVEVTLKDAGMSLQIYGYVRGDVAYDSQRTAIGDLAFFVLPHVNGEDDAQTSFTARQTRFGLKLAGPDTENWKTTGRIEMDFYGRSDSANSAHPRMRLAWIDLANNSGLSFRAGQDWDTFVAVIPRIVNFSYLADAGALGLRRPQVRVTQKVKIADGTALNMKLAVAQTIGQDLDGGGQDDGADAEIPTLQWNLGLSQKLWCEKSARIAFSGHYGVETMDTVVSNAIVDLDTSDYDTWSAQASLYIPLTKCLAVQGTFWTGENLDSYFGGIGQGVNMTLDTSIEAQGGWAQLLYDPTDKLGFALGFSMDDPKDEDLNAGQRAKNENILLNGSYKINKAVCVFAEYSHMTTDYVDADDAQNDRIQLAMQYNF